MTDEDFYARLRVFLNGPAAKDENASVLVAIAVESRTVLHAAQYELARDACHGGACDCLTCSTARRLLGSGT
mgnify:CR=1 FL=1